MIYLFVIFWITLAVIAITLDFEENIRKVKNQQKQLEKRIDEISNALNVINLSNTAERMLPSASSHITIVSNEDSTFLITMLNQNQTQTIASGTYDECLKGLREFAETTLNNKIE